VAEAFLRKVGGRFAGRAGETLLLNGRDLAGVPDASYDLVAAYSVLHHIPDYLAAVREMTRVVRPGGLLLLDHEINDAYYEHQPAYEEFRRKARRQRRWAELRTWSGLKRRLARAFGRKLPPRPFQGDIHVRPDDHIEWDRLRQLLGEAGWRLVREEDYLPHKPKYPRQVWEACRNKVTDYRLLVAQRPEA
jgi:SAM-dependent methyltransferase